MADNTQDQNQIETDLLTQLDTHFSRLKQIQSIVMKQAEATQAIIAATEKIKANNAAIKAEIQQLTDAQSGADDVTPEQEAALNDLNAAVAESDALAAGTASGGDTSGAAPVPGIQPFTTDAEGNTIDAIGQRVDANGNVIPTQGV
jgi:hypothetical protein